MTSKNQTESGASAIVRHNKGYVSVLCPMGHLITAHKWDFQSSPGSMFEAELAAHAAGLPNRFDRAAAKCNGAGHYEI